jgi:inner membrane protein
MYIVFTLVNKYEVRQHFAKELARQQIHYTELYTSPSLFNNFLWAGIAATDDSIWLGEYSILQKPDEVKWAAYARNNRLINNWPDKHSIDLLLWFSQGKYFAQQQADTLKFYNVKWGRGDFRETNADRAIPFYFMLYPANGGWIAKPTEFNMTREQFNAAFKALWRRILYVN